MKNSDLVSIVNYIKKKKIQCIQAQQNTWVDLIWPPGFQFATSASTKFEMKGVHGNYRCPVPPENDLAQCSQ